MMSSDDHPEVVLGVTGATSGLHDSTTTASMTKTPTSVPQISADIRYYSVDPKKLQSLQEDKPWMKSAKYFTKVAVSPSAVTKMMMHCASGVEKGISQGGNPVEVMGLMLGRPDPHCPTTLIVTDAFPLPIEGFETRVIADDQAVVNHMISLNECLERTRKERFMGWYHSHPFDLGDHSHCFLSQTDLSTQLQWQRAEDPHGNPFVAIVVDPLRTAHTGVPELKAFRAFPPEYESAIPNECPDGSIEPTEQVRLEHWGSCWNRYYELSVEYYMSSTSRKILGDLTQNYLWMTAFKRRDERDKLKSLRETEIAVKALTSAGSGSATRGGGTGGSGNISESTSSANELTMSMFPSAMDVTSAAEAKASSSASTMIHESRTMQPIVAKLQTAATQELTQATLRRMQKKVFQKPSSSAMTSP